MVLIFFLNVWSLVLAVRGRMALALAIPLAAVGIFGLGYVKHPVSTDGLSMLLEGAVCSAGLILCWQKQARAYIYYMVGLAAALLFLAVVQVVPALREALQGEMNASINDSKAMWGKLPFSSNGAAENGLTQGLILFFPTYWLLGALVRLGLVRLTVYILSPRESKPWNPAAFSQFRAGDPVLWALIGGLVLEVVGKGGWVTAAHNMVFFSALIYLLQGLALLQFWFERQKTSLIFRIAFYLMMAFTQIPLLVAAIFGLIDTWIDFRTRNMKPRYSNTGIQGENNGSDSQAER